MVAVGENQRGNVTQRKVWLLTHPVPPPSLASTWAALRTSFHTLSRLDFFLLYPTFSSFWPFYPLFLLSVNSCSFSMVILHCTEAPWRQGSHCIMGSWHVGRNNWPVTVTLAPPLRSWVNLVKLLMFSLSEFPHLFKWGRIIMLLR